jgi:hypothetical protein
VTAENEGESTADCERGIAATMRSGSEPFLFVFVKHARVPVGHCTPDTVALVHPI